MNSSEIRANARLNLQGKWKKAALLSLTYMATFFVIVLIQILFNNKKDVLSSLINLAVLLIEIPLGFGFIISFFNLYNNVEFGYFDFIKNGLKNFKKSWGITLLTTLKILVPIILMFILNIITIAISFSAMLTTTSSILDFIPILCTIGSVTCFIWIISISYSYAFTYYIAIENENLSSSECLKRSKELMKGNRLKLIVLELTFIGWAILSLFTLGIGYIWLIPYIQIATIIFYKKLVPTNNVNSNVIESSAETNT